MHWSKALISLLAVGLPLSSAHPLSSSTSISTTSVSLPSIEVPTTDYSDDTEKTRRSDLVARNDVIKIEQNAVAFLDPKGKQSKIYPLKNAQAQGESPKSDKALKTTVNVETTSLGPCFAFALVDDARGGMLGHFSPVWCRWVQDPKSVGAADAKEAGFAKSAFEKILKKNYDNILANGELWLIWGPETESQQSQRALQESQMRKILQDAGLPHNTLRSVGVPKYADNEPGKMDPATAKKKIISLSQQPNQRLLLKMGDQVLRQ